MQPREGRRRGRGVLAGALIAALFSSPAHAASVCYDLTHFPAVEGLSLEGDALTATLPPVAGRKRKTSLGADGQWSPLEDAGTGPPATGLPWVCDPRIPELPLTREELYALRPELQSQEHAYTPNQSATACIEANGFLWFGLGYYAGEGMTGAGGLGRLDLATGEVEIRRPVALRTVSINAIEVVDDRVLLGTTGNYECLGTPPARGLYLYLWDEDEAWGGRETSMCGFVIHDLLVKDDTVWAATDMGLSRTDDFEFFGRWKNFVPDESGGMRAIECPALYDELISTLPTDDLMFLDNDSSLGLLLRNLLPSKTHHVIRWIEAHRTRVPDPSD